MMLVAQTYFLPEIVAVAPALVHAPFALFVAAIAELEPETRAKITSAVAALRLIEILMDRGYANSL
jgi:hypothetical protein